MVLLVATTSAVMADPAIRSKADEWQVAATLREAAAATLQLQAERAAAESLEKSRGRFENEAHRRAILEQCAESMRRAGDLHMAAAANLDRAAENWLRGATALGRANHGPRERDARQAAAEARAAAAEAIAKAAAAYEQAAVWYGEDGADRPAKAGEAAEKAAACRERLAER